MLETGIFDSEPIEAVFAGHMHPEHPAGHVGIAPNVSNAAADNLIIHLKGKGGHGAGRSEHESVPPVFVRWVVVCVGTTSGASATVEPPPQEPGPGLGGRRYVRENFA